MRPLPTLPGEPHGVPTNRPRCCVMHRAYPPALLASTLLAGFFCYLYLTKPVVQITKVVAKAPPAKNAPSAVEATPPAAATAASATPVASHPTAPPSLVPKQAHLPGDPAPKATADLAKDTVRKPSTVSEYGLGFEETNLRVQHALSAEGPDGELGRILLEVPVLYESRRLRWTPEQVAEARQLLERLRAHEDNLRAVRQEGNSLLAAWNHLIERSIPGSLLRADSPTLPVNQGNGLRAPAPTGLDTSESIRVSSSKER